MRASRFTIILLCGAALASILFAGDAKGTQSSSTISVGLTIPSGSSDTTGCTGNCNPTPDTVPVISNVASSTTVLTARVTWSATDDKGISTATQNFLYGLTSYTTQGAITGSGNYAVDLTGLATSTSYVFKISVTDSAGQAVESTGRFTTASGQDTTPPNISGITISPTTTAATISWATNEPASGQINYGVTGSYGSSQLASSLASSQAVTLPNLVPSTTYHFRIIATDAAGNSSSTFDAVFNTAKDTVPPAQVSNLALTTSSASLALTWQNPAAPDFAGVKIQRKIGSSPTSISDGTALATTTLEAYTDSAVTTSVHYFYALFSFDTSQNYSGAALIDGQLVPAPAAPTEICSNDIDDDNNGKKDCADPACSAAQVCQTEICNNQIDDNDNQKTDCADAACVDNAICKKAVPEQCGNGADDDQNGFTDCADPACAGYSGCFTKATTTYTPDPVTIGEDGKLTIRDLVFFIGNRQLTQSPAQETITGLAGAQATVGLPQVALAGEIKSLLWKIAGRDTHSFKKEADRQMVDYTFPAVGEHDAYVEVSYQAGTFDAVRVQLRSLPLGNITSDSQPTPGATVSLFSQAGQLVVTAPYGYPNPQTSDNNGLYGWVVPNGEYYLTVTKAGFYDRQTGVFTVDALAVNQTIKLIAKPELLTVEATSTIAEAAVIIGKNTIAKTKALAKIGLQKIADIKNDKEAQKVAGTIVVPTIVGAVAISTVTLVSWVNILSYLRFLFLQPLMLLGLRRRGSWGQVYNTLSKLPIDLATIRLLNAETGRVLQSKVTDKKGRYAFVVNPGSYRLEVLRNNFIFPTNLLAGTKEDGRRTDIYHGEPIVVTEKDAVITANIPLDPVGETKKPTRIFWQRLGRTVQLSLSWLGIIVTAFSLYISPRWYVWAMLVVHCFLFILFRRLAIAPKIKNWGIVYDHASKAPVGRVVARLFNSQFNKMVSSQITDGQGRYYFLAGEDQYYVTYDHPEYLAKKTEVIDLTGKEADTIHVDVSLVKGLDKPTTPPALPPETAISAPPANTAPPEIVPTQPISPASEATIVPPVPPVPPAPPSPETIPPPTHLTNNNS